MPSNVRWFERIFIFAGIFAAVTLPWAGQPVTFSLLAFCLVWWGFVFLLVWLTSRRRKNWARWTLFALFLLETALTLKDDLRAHTTADFIRLTVTSLEAISYWFIFTGNSSAWFRKQPVA
jgi:hypothetical protein